MRTVSSSSSSSTLSTLSRRDQPNCVTPKECKRCRSLRSRSARLRLCSDPPSCNETAAADRDAECSRRLFRCACSVAKVGRSCVIFWLVLLLPLLLLWPDLSKLFCIPSFSGDTGRQGGMIGAGQERFNKGLAYCCDMVRGSDMGNIGVGAVARQSPSVLSPVPNGRCLAKSTTTSPCFAKSTTTSPCRAARSASSLSSSMYSSS